MPTHPAPPRTGAQIREAFLAYFEQELGHKRLPSASLVPANNPTVLLTPAGMLPFVPIFLGVEPAPNPPRATTSQKCARVSGKASDLEAVGRTPRHHTFFEMLGNFSFGDYFKADVIPWAWRFVTEVLQLPAERLWVSVFRDDDESYAIWNQQVGVPAERIFRCDEADNFWGPPGPTGPCGPCTEIHYDLTQNPNDPLDTRLVEIWNLVFMESFKDAEGRFTPLEHKNVDTGAGLERLAMVVQGVANTFETDLFTPLMAAVSAACGVPYGAGPATDVALKIVADHLRFIAFALADGVVPSNEGRGYILRMILRRALRYGKQYLGFEGPFLAALLPTIVAYYGEAYPELLAKAAASNTLLLREEHRFLETLDKGSKHLEEELQALKASGGHVFSGAMAFRLYDTYGFPLELTKDVLQEQGLSLDEAGFEAAMDEQKQLARGARKHNALVNDTVYADIVGDVGPSTFVGYQALEHRSTVQALIVEGQRVSTVSGTNTPFELVLAATPFYPEGGGQVGDKGHVLCETGQEGGTALVLSTRKVGQLIVHSCLWDQGKALQVGDALLASVDDTHRQGSACHHSATHLLHAALRQVLGPEVTQAGSSVTAEGARFDVSFPRAISASELLRVEALANQWITANYAKEAVELPLEEAKAAGALAMFDEKYGDTVRMVRFGPASVELCGGTHVASTATIGVLRITGEQAVAAGVRRIEFEAGPVAYRGFRQQENRLKELAGALKCPAEEVLERVQKLQEGLKQSEKQVALLEEQSLLGLAPQLAEALREAASSGMAKPHVLHCLPKAAPAAALKALGEAAMAMAPAEQPALLLLAAPSSGDEGGGTLLALANAVAQQQGLAAGAVLSQVAKLCGGGGGGKPAMAQAGLKVWAQLPSAVAQVLG
jgi:alanyl-tRNA synthetase